MNRELNSIKLPGMSEALEIPKSTVFELDLNSIQTLGIDDKPFIPSHYDLMSELISATSGDICVITDKDGAKFTYSMNENDEWIPLVGKIHARDIIFDSNICVSGDFDSIGNVESKTIFSKGSNLEEIMRSILENHDENIEIIKPTIDVECLTGTDFPVGTKLEKTEWRIRFNPGKYEYGPETGSTMLEYQMADSMNTSAEIQYQIIDGKPEMIIVTKGFEVKVDTEYSIRGIFKYSEGVPAYDECGVETTVKLEEGQGCFGRKASEDFPVIRGYYPVYAGLTFNGNQITENKIRYTGGEIIKISGDSKADSLVLMIPEIYGNILESICQKNHVFTYDITSLVEKHSQELHDTIYNCYIYKPDLFGKDDFIIKLKEAAE